MKLLALTLLLLLLWKLLPRYKGYEPIEYEEPWGV